MFKLILAVIVSAIVSPVMVLASSDSDEHVENGGATHKEWSKKSDEEKRAEIKGHIEHHVQDAYEFVLFSSEKDHQSIGFGLPVILWDNGIHFFSGSSFEHGKATVESNGKYYKLYHNKIYEVDGAQGEINLDKHKHPTNATPIDISITKNVMQY